MTLTEQFLIVVVGFSLSVFVWYRVTEYYEKGPRGEVRDVVAEVFGVFSVVLTLMFSWAFLFLLGRAIFT